MRGTRLSTAGNRSFSLKSSSRTTNSLTAPGDYKDAVAHPCYAARYERQPGKSRRRDPDRPDDPSILLEAQASPSLEVHGCDPDTAQRIRDCAGSVLAKIHAGSSVSITVRKLFRPYRPRGRFPARAAPARACCELYGKTMTTGELARMVGVAEPPGIGTAAFEHGGFIVDGGHRFGPGCGKNACTLLRVKGRTAAAGAHASRFPRGLADPACDPLHSRKGRAEREKPRSSGPAARSLLMRCGRSATRS